MIYVVAIRPASLRLQVVAARATAQQAKLDLASAALARPPGSGKVAYFCRYVMRPRVRS